MMKNSTLIAAALFGGILGLMAPFTDTPPEQAISVSKASLSTAMIISQ